MGNLVAALAIGPGDFAPDPEPPTLLHPAPGGLVAVVLAIAVVNLFHLADLGVSS